MQNNVAIQSNHVDNKPQDKDHIDIKQNNPTKSDNIYTHVKHSIQSMETEATLHLQPPGNIAVIIPCYNEEKTISQVIDEVFSVLPYAHIYVFDNNSSDNSRSIVRTKINEIKASKSRTIISKDNQDKEQETNYPNIMPHNDGSINCKDSCIKEAKNLIPKITTSCYVEKDLKSTCLNRNQGNYVKSLTLYSVSTQGKGAVMREAFALIEADLYVMIDADTEHDASILPYALTYFSTNKLDMLNIAREADSSTYRRGHSFGNKLFSKSTQMLFGTKINDMLSGYRIFSRPFVKSFPAHSNGFEIETELTIYALEQRLRTDEIKAPYKSRPEGSFSKLSTFKDGFKILLMILKLLFSERPLLVFGVLGGLCFLLSLIFGIPIFLEFLETSKVARFPTLFVCVGLMVIAVILFIAGLLAHLVTKSIRESRYLAYLQSHREYVSTK